MTVAKARKTMCKAFEKDPEFRETYIANIAMLLYDNIGPGIGTDVYNEISNKILNMIFD